LVTLTGPRTVLPAQLDPSKPPMRTKSSNRYQVDWRVLFGIKKERKWLKVLCSPSAIKLRNRARDSEAVNPHLIAATEFRDSYQHRHPLKGGVAQFHKSPFPSSRASCSVRRFCARPRFWRVPRRSVWPSALVPPLCPACCPRRWSRLPCWSLLSPGQKSGGDRDVFEPTTGSGESVS
jgi:hypothetical protein